MTDRPAALRSTFPWRRTRALLEELDERWSFTRAPHRRHFVSRLDPRVTFTPPLVQAIPPGIEGAVDYLARLPATPGLQLVVLLQAGACALGLWNDDELLAHKALKKYVVRGRGRAQPAHLRARGKSRYGSRLRLRNARRLMDEVVARTAAWHAAHGPFATVLHSAPARAWSELLHWSPPPPFPPAGESVRIPLDVHVPCFEELRRVRRKLVRGAYTLPSPRNEGSGGEKPRL